MGSFNKLHTSSVKEIYLSMLLLLFTTKVYEQYLGLITNLSKCEHGCDLSTAVLYLKAVFTQTVFYMFYLFYYGLQYLSGFYEN